MEPTNIEDITRKIVEIATELSTDELQTYVIKFTVIKEQVSDISLIKTNE